MVLNNTGNIFVKTEIISRQMKILYAHNFVEKGNMTVKILEISLLKQKSFLVRWNILYAPNFVEKGNMTVTILEISLL